MGSSTRASRRTRQHAVLSSMRPSAPHAPLGHTAYCQRARALRLRYRCECIDLADLDRAAVADLTTISAMIAHWAVVQWVARRITRVYRRAWFWLVVLGLLALVLPAPGRRPHVTPIGRAAMAAALSPCDNPAEDPTQRRIADWLAPCIP